jgi:hypothetical protein
MTAWASNVQKIFERACPVLMFIVVYNNKTKNNESN